MIIYDPPNSQPDRKTYVLFYAFPNLQNLFQACTFDKLYWFFFISCNFWRDKSAVSLLYWGRKERMSLKIKINIVCKVFGKYIVAKFTYFITTCHGGWKSFHTRMLKKSFKSNNLISHTQGIRYGFLTRRTDDVPTLQTVLPGNYYKHGAWVGGNAFKAKRGRKIH